MFTVSAKKVRTHAYVGIYPGEAKVPNEIEVDLSLSIDADIDDLPFIDYTHLHAIIFEAVKEPVSLMETVLQRIVKGSLELYPQAKVRLSLKKLNPPIMGQLECFELDWQS